jgi:hypothetical protein
MTGFLRPKCTSPFLSWQRPAAWARLLLSSRSPWLLLALLLLLPSCALNAAPSLPSPVVLGLTREPFIEFGETGVNVIATVRNEGATGTVRLAVKLTATGNTITHNREFMLLAGETRQIPLRFEEPAFVDRLLSLGVRAVGSAALGYFSGGTAVVLGNVLAEKLGLAGVDALADFLDIRVSAQIVAINEAFIAPKQGFLGAKLQTEAAGLRVISLRAGAPAALAGLRGENRNLIGMLNEVGDLIVALNGQKLSLAAFEERIKATSAGERLQLSLLRGNKAEVITLELVVGAASEYNRGG